MSKAIGLEKSTGPPTRPKKWGGGASYDAKRITTAKNDVLPFKGNVCKKLEGQDPGGPGVK